MNRFDSIDASSINRVRINPKQTNEIGNASSLVGLWILLPLAISGLAFVGIHIVMTIFFGNSVTINWNQVLLISWLLVSIICQSIYWMRITKSLGLTSFAGLWSLVPVAGWFKTFRFAYLAVGKNKGYPSYMASAVEESDTVRFQPKSRTGVSIRVKSIEVPSDDRKFLVKYKKQSVFILRLLVVTAISLIIFYIVDPKNYLAKRSALNLISAFQDVEETYVYYEEYDQYSEKIDPLIDNFIKRNTNQDTPFCSREAVRLAIRLGSIGRIGQFNPRELVNELEGYVRTCS